MIYNEAAVLPAVLLSMALMSLCAMALKIKIPQPLKVLLWLSKAGSSEEEIKSLDKRLKALNIPVTAEMYAAGRLVLTAIPLLTGGIFLLSNFFGGLLYIVMALLAWRLPNLFIQLIEKRRKEEMVSDFVLMVNQVRIYTKAAGIYQALKIVPYCIKGPLGKELKLLSAEMEMSPLAEALDSFAKRCGLKEVEDFAQIILIGIRTGADISQVLSNYAKVTQRQKIGRIKRWIKMQPVIMSILPAMMLMIFILMWIVPMYMNIIQRLKAI